MSYEVILMQQWDDTAEWLSGPLDSDRLADEVNYLSGLYDAKRLFEVTTAEAERMVAAGKLRQYREY